MFCCVLLISCLNPAYPAYILPISCLYPAYILLQMPILMLQIQILMLQMQILMLQMPLLMLQMPILMLQMTTFNMNPAYVMPMPLSKLQYGGWPCTALRASIIVDGASSCEFASKRQASRYLFHICYALTHFTHRMLSTQMLLAAMGSTFLQNNSLPILRFFRSLTNLFVID